MTNAASENSIRAREKQRKKDEETNATVISTLMRTVDGRRWIWLQLERMAVFRADEGLDPLRMAFDKGIRNEGLRLLASVTRHCPDEYIRMTQENTSVQLNANKFSDEEPDDDRDTHSTVQ